MKRQKAINLLALTVAAIALHSCSADELAGDDMQRGKKYPLTLTAYVADVQARSTGKDAWSDGDEIGVSLSSTLANGDAYSVEGKYKYDSNKGGMSAVSGSEIYWQSTNAANVTAWFPCGDVSETDISNQSAGYTTFDFLKAETSDVSFNTSATLAFNHQMSKVTCTLVKGEQLPDDLFAQAKLTISGYTSASFSKGDVTPTGNLGDITPYADGDNTYTALLVPYTASNSSPFFTISIGNTTFYYIPSEETKLEAGNAYNYTITVKVDGVEVICNEIGEWGKGKEREVSGNTIFLADVKGDYTVEASSTVTIDGEGTTLNKRIYIQDGAIVTLKNVRLSATDNYTVYCNGSVTIIIEGKNVISAADNYSAIYVRSNYTLTIKGSGELEATGGASGAGIGSGYDSSCGDITIMGGVITARGGINGAGIGSGYFGKCGNILITGQETQVTAVCYDKNSQPIGSGNLGKCGTVTIEDGAKVNQSYVWYD